MFYRHPAVIVADTQVQHLRLLVVLDQHAEVLGIVLRDCPVQWREAESSFLVKVEDTLLLAEIECDGEADCLSLLLMKGHEQRCQVILVCPVDIDASLNQLFRQA